MRWGDRKGFPTESMSKPFDLKSTLNLPRTDFPMKARLPEREPEQLAEWEKDGIYERILESRAGRPLFVLHDGPPYPTGDIHLGTGLNKICKDLVVKSKTMAGFRSPFIPGWDCHGLPIESKVEKEDLGGHKDRVSPAEFRRLCREYATKFVDSNRRDFKRLGIFGQWAEPYLTMDPRHEASIAEAFVTFLEKGYVYRGLKPVYWCFVDRTALAEAEVVYGDHTSHSIWVKFPVVGAARAKDLGPDVSALIWTTTPWTLPANRALAFHPDFNYVVAETPGGALLFAEERLVAIAEELKLEAVKIRWKGKGSELEGMEFQHPFLDFKVPGVLADYVTLEQGSGVVHTAPGHGAEDFYTGQRYGLETYAPIDDDGRFVEGLPEYKGLNVFQANEPIMELLRARGALAGSSKHRHSYPHCWRCHNPVIFRATEQWFISMDANNLRKRALEEIDKVKWTPAWGHDRLYEMIAERPDWCISRQRFWGVPLIIFTCGACKTRLNDFAALRHVLKFFEKEGADAWFTRSAEELLPPGTNCPNCGNAQWKKENDILDVWFDSGSTHLGVLSLKDGTWPADVYLEGPDQFRGWFQSSLLVGVGTRDRAPYKHVVAHGWTLDAKGEPMSKSLGNFVSPRDVADKWGADMVRLWVASQDYFDHVRYSEGAMTQLSETYRKLRNTFRFALSNLADFDPERDALRDSELWEMDAWMLRRTGELVRRGRAWYESFDFHRVFHTAHDFAVVDLSAFYFDLLKDRLYTFAPRSVGRRSAQTAIYRIASALLRLLAPIIVYTAEEIWKHVPKEAGAPASVHMAYFPEAEELERAATQAVANNWEQLLVVRSEVLKALEQARVAKTISASLEAKVTIAASGERAKLLEKYKTQLPALFIVSQVHLESGGSADGVAVKVEHADGKKCERCWNYSTHVGEYEEYPTICERCKAALDEIARTAGVAGS
jgi:isoleucyl-tRNA synthetase